MAGKNSLAIGIILIFVLVVSSAVLGNHSYAIPGLENSNMVLMKESGNESEKHVSILVFFKNEIAPLEDDYPPPREMTWTAYTNLVRAGSLFRWYPKLYACSKSRWEDTGEPADIQHIGIRSRVWKKVGYEWEQIYSRRVDRYYDSDACVYWSGSEYGGEYLAKSNHWFEANSVVTWYPETQDTVDCY